MISVAFLAMLALIVFITSISTDFAKLEPIHVFVALVPFIVLLVVSGRLGEVTAPGGISFKMRDEVRKPVLPEATGMELEVDPAITMEKGAIPAIQDRIAQNPPTALSLKVQWSGYYSEFAIRQYLEELRQYPGFRNILFTDKEGRFKGLMRAQRISRLSWKKKTLFLSLRAAESWKT
jgi:hypothetical protein